MRRRGCSEVFNLHFSRLIAGEGIKIVSHDFFYICIGSLLFSHFFDADGSARASWEFPRGDTNCERFAVLFEIHWNKYLVGWGNGLFLAGN